MGSLVSVAVAIIATTLAVVLAPVTQALQETHNPIKIAATEALVLRQVDRLIDQMLREGTLEMASVELDPLIAGRIHERLAQFHRGVRIFGADITRQSIGRLTTSIFGELHMELQLNTVPTLSWDEALAQLEADFGRQPITSAQPDLVVLRHPDTGNYHLAYHVTAWSTNGLMVCFIDAHTGKLLWEYDSLKRQVAWSECSDCAIGEAVGVKGDRKKISVRKAFGTFSAEDGLRPATIATYDMGGNWSRTRDILNGQAQLFVSDIATDPDNNWLDGPSVDAHTGAGWTYDYLFHRFGRRGLDGTNSRMISIVHPVNRLDLLDVPDEIVSLFYLNAFFCGGCISGGVIVYGEGLPAGWVLANTGQSVDFFSAGLDVVAHELAHGITNFTSQLIYQNESGALNESFSDIIGISTEFFMADTGRHQTEQADYVLGEDVIKPGGIRNISDPMALGDPDHYSHLLLGETDNGYVHANSTIPSHAFYLAIEGGLNRTSGLSVNGVGAFNRAQIEQVFYRGFTLLLPASATFSTARASTIQSARDLFGAGSTVELAVTEAWTAVGVH